MTVSPDTLTVPSATSGSYLIDPNHTNLGFVARHAMVTKVRGNFSDVEGHLTLDVENPANSTADLTIKGTTKPVTVHWEFTGAATDPFGNDRVGFEGHTVINRTDFGLTWNAPLGSGGVLVSEKITLELEVSAIKATNA